MLWCSFIDGKHQGHSSAWDWCWFVQFPYRRWPLALEWIPLSSKFVAPYRQQRSLCWDDEEWCRVQSCSKLGNFEESTFLTESQTKMQDTFYFLTKCHTKLMKLSSLRTVLFDVLFFTYWFNNQWFPVGGTKLCWLYSLSIFLADYMVIFWTYMLLLTYLRLY